MSNKNNRIGANIFSKVSDGEYRGSFTSLQAALTDLSLYYSHQSRNGNEVWTLYTVSPIHGAEVPVGSATYNHPDEPGEPPYFLGRIEDPSFPPIPFRMTPIDPENPDSDWQMRYNPPQQMTQGAQNTFGRTQRRAMPPRSTTLGASTGFPSNSLNGAGNGLTGD